MDPVSMITGGLIGAALAGLAVMLIYRSREDKLKASQLKLQTTLEVERKNAQEKVRLLDQASVELQNAFKALSSDALKDNNQAFLDLARTVLAKQQSEAKGALELRKKEVETLVKPISESLASVTKEVRNLEQARKEAYGALREQVKSMSVTQSELQGHTENLVKALRKPHVRGRWGEIQLRRVVEMAGMVQYCDFTEQTVTDENDDIKLRPDLIVNLPAGRKVVVDAKTPLEAYLDALDADDEEEKHRLRGEHARQVRNHIYKLSTKGYWKQFEDAPDFVVLFLPGEVFFSAALEEDPHLIEIGASHQVILATPTTLIALLKAVAYGWRQEKMAESAREVSELGKVLYDRVRSLANHFAGLGNSLDRAVDLYNKAVGSLENRVLATVRKFPELGVNIREEIPTLPHVDKAVREIQAHDLVEEPEEKEKEEEAEQKEEEADETMETPLT